jgi:hypothetical protein
MIEKLAVHPSEFWTAAETIEKLYKRKTCIAGDRGDCDGQIIEAHTIPKSQLRKIAVDGHVYDIRATAGDLYRNDGEYSVGKRGISQFSVLNFFCSEHDREIFSHLESDDLVFDDHQLALLHYRAMGAELYKKMNAINVTRFFVERLKGRRDRETTEKLRFAKDMGDGHMLGLRDMSKTFSRCERVLVDKDYTQVHAVVFCFKRMPSIMTVGGFSPEFDYDERPLQRLGKIESEYHQIGFSILAGQGRAAVIFTWLQEAHVCEQFVRSLLTKNPNLYATLAIQTAFEHLENTCMNMPWWDGLRPIERNMLLRRMQFAGSPVEERMASCLGYCGITFDQWEFDEFGPIRLDKFGG